MEIQAREGTSATRAKDDDNVYQNFQDFVPGFTGAFAQRFRELLRQLLHTFVSEFVVMKVELLELHVFANDLS